MNVLKIEVIIWAPAIIVVRLASRLVRSPASGRADAPSPKGSSQHYLRVPILPIDVDMNNDSERVQMNLGLAITNEKLLITDSFVQISKRLMMIGAVTLAITDPTISQNSELQQVQMASLPDGTSYESQTLMNAAA